MVVLWVFDVALTMLGWLVSLFGFMDPLVLPSAFTLTVPVPLLGSSGVASMQTWWSTFVTVSIALAIGSMLQWIYKMVPFKAT